ncbi:MAG: NAD(P)/FAD-dependent oxidoreductase [Oscillospiraceae bacterium]|nr:NAD(P)/FAD-dependent oxidoreductase [Oscillospiraceae bacterium]
MERFDIAIIGTGPAGISAALTAHARNKRFVLLGSTELSPKISKAHRIDNYPGLPMITGREFAEQLKAQLAAMEIPVTGKQVSAVYATGDFFTLQAGEEMLEADTVIVATGVMQGKLLPGEEAFLGRGVSYCATCDARLYRGKTVAVIGSSADAAKEAEFLAEIVENVLYFPISGELPSESEKLRIFHEKPVEIIGEKTVSTLKTDQGEHEISCVFVLRDAVMPDKLVPGVETDGAHICVDLSMRTNIPGLFACGDIAGKPYQYVKSAGQGNVAALSAVSYLQNKK